MHNCWRLGKNTFLWRLWKCPNIMNQWINVSWHFWKLLGLFSSRVKNMTERHNITGWKKMDSLQFTMSNSMFLPIFVMSSCFAWTGFHWIVSLSATKESYGMLSPLAVFSSFLPSCKMLSSAAWSSNSNWEDLAVELINCCQTLRQILNRLVVWFHATLKHGLENQLNQHNQNHHFLTKKEIWGTGLQWLRFPKPLWSALRRDVLLNSHWNLG